jgi:iron complex outermembrane receptor protein
MLKLNGLTPSRFLSVWVFALLSLGALTAPALAAAATFEIEPQDLSGALKAFAVQSHREIFFAPELARGRTSKGVKGKFDDLKALNIILEGTGLNYSVTASNAILVRDPTSTAGPAQSPASSDDANTPKEAGKKSSQDFRVAQVDQSAAGPQAIDSQSSEKKKQEGLSEIVVTGTLIRGVETASPMTVVDRDYIRKTGSATIPEVLQTLSLNYGGDETESTRALPGGSASNIGHGSSPNIHGLGAISTLVLIDGHRIAPAAFGQMTDISLIPLSAVERIEILADGASATYGSDAVGGVVNIILRRDFEGAETQVQGGIATQGEPTESRFSQTLGGTWGSGNGLLTVEHYKRGNLDDQDRQYARNAGERYDLLPKQESNSAIGTMNIEPWDGVRLKGTALFSRRTFFQNAFNTPAFTEQTEDGVTQQLSTTGGIGIDLPNSWENETYAVYSRSKTDVNVNDREAAVDTRYVNTLQVESLDTKFDGPLFALGGGSAKLAIGGSVRRETFNPQELGLESKARNVLATFAEFSLPLVTDRNAVSGIRELELSLAARYEHYSDFGSTTNPKVGLLWSPAAGVKFRGTFGTSFRAPIFYELDPYDDTSALLDLPNPSAPSGTTLTLLLNGNNPTLRPEKGTTWTGGLDLQPEMLPGFKTGATFFDTRYHNRIVAPLQGADVFGAFDQAAIYAPLFTANPDPALVSQLIATHGQFFNLHGPFAPGDVQAILDRRLQNISEEDIQGIDFEGSYNVKSSVGDWLFALSSTYFLQFKDFITSSAPANDVRGTTYHPSDFKGRATVSWTRGQWSAASSVNYISGSKNETTSPVTEVASWTTTDLQFAYQLPLSSARSSNLRIAFTVLNLFDRDPPFVTSPQTLFNVGYDPTNANPLGRFVSLNATLKW